MLFFFFIFLQLYVRLFNKRVYNHSFLQFTFVNCSKSEEEDKPSGYLQEESNIPDYDNDPIYSKANPKNFQLIGTYLLNQQLFTVLIYRKLQM